MEVVERLSYTYIHIHIHIHIRKEIEQPVLLVKPATLSMYVYVFYFIRLFTLIGKFTTIPWWDTHEVCIVSIYFGKWPARKLFLQEYVSRYIVTVHELCDVT